MSRETTRTLSKPEMKDRMFSLGAEIVASTPAQLAAFMRADIAKMGKVIKDAGIHE